MTKFEIMRISKLRTAEYILQTESNISSHKKIQIVIVYLNSNV
jgi:hypothetical protein